MSSMERIPSQFGAVLLAADGPLVREVHLRNRGGADTAKGPLAADLRRYFTGDHVDFTKYEVDWSGYTTFERSVLEATRKIPYGQTRTYGDIAAKVGKLDAARAVGQALGKNRTCIVVPCHRVVAANGGLGGFSGGIHWKKDLLALERASVRG